MYDSSRYISVAGHFWGQIWSCVVAPRQIPPHVDTGNLSRFPFGSRELDSIGKGAGMVQFAEGGTRRPLAYPFFVRVINASVGFNS